MVFWFSRPTACGMVVAANEKERDMDTPENQIPAKKPLPLPGFHGKRVALAK